MTDEFFDIPEDEIPVIEPVTCIALVKDNVVTNVILATLSWARNFALGDNDLAMEAGDARKGWVLIDGELHENIVDDFKEKSVDELKTELKQQISALKWEHEIGGITIGGIPISTGIDDQNRINTVLTAGQIAGLQSVDFKSAAGWVTLTIDQIRGIAVAIAFHVQACFSAERAHHEAIEALETVEELTEYDVNSGWPP